jgi:SAM-dependent methyltransferase
MFLKKLKNLTKAVVTRLLPYRYKIERFKLKQFKKDYALYSLLDINKRFPVSKADLYPRLDDNTPNTHFDAHYIYHPAWAARIINEIKPALHTDISSTLHFCTIVSAFVKTEFYDYRPAILNLVNLNCKHADLTNLPFESNSITSLSCMHTIEHVGLGRYGDPIAPDGDLKAFSELKRVCAINGNLLIVVPVGVKKIQFNAHRIYNPFDVVSYMDGFTLKNFALINDAGTYLDTAELSEAAKQIYGCGCFWFEKSA